MTFRYAHGLVIIMYEAYITCIRAYFKEFLLGDNRFDLFSETKIHKLLPPSNKNKPNSKNIDWLTSFYTVLDVSIILLLLASKLQKLH